MRYNEDYYDNYVYTPLNEYTNNEKAFIEFINTPSKKLDDVLVDYSDISNISYFKPIPLSVALHNHTELKPYSLIFKHCGSFEISKMTYDYNKVDEGLIKTYNSNFVKRFLSDENILKLFESEEWVKKLSENGDNVAYQIYMTFPINPCQISVEHHNDKDSTFILRIPVIGRNIEMIEHVMNSFGYFLIRNEDVAGVGSNWKVLYFDPKYQKVITSIIKSNYSYLLHTAPVRYLKKILKRGLYPNAKNIEYSYPTRSYVLLPNHNYSDNNDFVKKVMRNVGLMLFHEKEFETVPEINDNIWVTFKIHIDKLRLDVDRKDVFYIDYTMPADYRSAFTTDNIPPNALEIFDVYEFEEYNYNDPYQEPQYNMKELDIEEILKQYT